MVTATRRGPRARARRQRAISHISAIESGPPETASTSAGAAFQSANSRFASLAEIGEVSSAPMGSYPRFHQADKVIDPQAGFSNRLQTGHRDLAAHAREIYPGMSCPR